MVRSFSVMVAAVAVGILLSGCGGGVSPAAVATNAASAAPGVGASPAVSVGGCPTAPTVSAAATLQPFEAVSGSGFSDVHTKNLEAGFGSVWAATTSGLVRLSVPDASPTTVVSEPVSDVALSSTSVFALSGVNMELLEIDPGSLKVMHRWALESIVGSAGGFGSIAHSLVAGTNAVYVDFRTTPPQIARFDTTTRAVVSVKLPDSFGSASGRELADDGSSIWMTDGAKLVKLDPTSLASRSTTKLPIRVDDLWFGDGSLWASSEQPGAGVLRIDPSSGCATAAVIADAVQIAFSPHDVWLSAAAGPIGVDPATGQQDTAVRISDVPDGSASGIATIGNEIWVAYYQAGLSRVQAVRSQSTSP